MHMIEYFGQLLANSSQVVNVEEAAVIDIVRGDAKMGGAPMLAAYQAVQIAPGGGFPFAAIKALERGGDGARTSACSRASSASSAFR